MANGPSLSSLSSSRGFGAAFLISVIVLSIMLAINARRIGAALDAERASVTEAEDQAFCTKFGAGPDSARYPECVSGLNAIRAKHTQRSADLFF